MNNARTLYQPYESSMVGSYFSTKLPWMKRTVRADFPTPPAPTTTILYSAILEAVHEQRYDTEIHNSNVASVRYQCSSCCVDVQTGLTDGERESWRCYIFFSWQRSLKSLFAKSVWGSSHPGLFRCAGSCGELIVQRKEKKPKNRKHKN